MKENRERGFRFTMKWEGGKFTDIPGDKGHGTKMGITLDLMKKLNLDLNHDHRIDNEDVKLVDDHIVRDIFFHKFWDAVDADNLPAGIDLIAADISFNSGPGKFFEFKKEGNAVSVEALTNRREKFYRYRATKPKQAQFLDGWLNRNDDSKIAARECGYV